MTSRPGKFARSAIVFAWTAAAVALAVTPVALADTSATVKARTQRMSAANLGSTQKGLLHE